MGIVIRSMRNVLRNPLCLLLVVFLLGASLMLVAAIIAMGLLVTLGPVISQAFNVSTPTAAATTPSGGFKGGFGTAHVLYRSHNAGREKIAPSLRDGLAGPGNEGRIAG